MAKGIHLEQQGHTDKRPGQTKALDKKGSHAQRKVSLIVKGYQIQEKVTNSESEGFDCRYKLDNRQNTYKWQQVTDMCIRTALRAKAALTSSEKQKPLKVAWVSIIKGRPWRLFRVVPIFAYSWTTSSLWRADLNRKEGVGGCRDAKMMPKALKPNENITTGGDSLIYGESCNT